MIPDFQALMRPVLELTSDGAVHPMKQVIDDLGAEFDVSDDERAELIPSGQRRFDNKAHWAVSHLFQAGLLERPLRAHIRITDRGRQALVEIPERIDVKALGRYPEYVAFRSRSRIRKADLSSNPTAETDDRSPLELAQAAEAENRAAVEGEILERVLAVSPRDFEVLVIKLLSKMGYGQHGVVEHSGQPGDRGIDGIISQDPLGLDRIYIQAKRYNGTVVQRPEIQKFVGALMGAQGDRGVFITSSRFTQGAIEEARRVNARIELIDGDRLAQLMVRHEVGVQADAPIVLYRVDEDFFEAL
ncbi:restriction endonuclease [Agromyces allii]|uniref:Restriction endonuclease n=1 Tax=Agromyces allii TaxID=393607 RepID=A0ABN2PZ10_9MICO|nr:restriction endonuclease [Agromyces allii]